MDILTANDRPAVYPQSYYASAVALPERRPPAQGSLRYDVCVVGAGYTGLSTALHLAQRGYSVAVLDANRAGWGASGRNGGHVGTGQRVSQGALEELVGKDRARTLWDMGLEAVALVRRLVERHAIDCDLGNGIIHACHKPRGVARAAAHVDLLRNDYGYDLIEALDRDRVREHVGSPVYHGGSLDRGSAHLQPLAYALGLARAAQDAGVHLYEHSRVRRLVGGDPVALVTDEATVSARHAVLALNGYHGDLVPALSRRIMPINNFVAATERLPEDLAAELLPHGHAVADSRFVVNYFRMSADRRLIFGGGESYGYRFPADMAGKVRRAMLGIYPQLAGVRIEHAWGGTLAITTNRLASFQRLGPNILSASGYSGHGVPTATFAGSVLAEAIDGQASRFDLLSSLRIAPFPGGVALRYPLLVLAMTWYALRDRL